MITSLNEDDWVTVENVAELIGAFECPDCNGWGCVEETWGVESCDRCLGYGDLFRVRLTPEAARRLGKELPQTKPPGSMPVSNM